jgi:hypothetical protein
VSRKKAALFKKSAQKFLLAGPWALVSSTPMTQRSKSLFASFSSEKEALTYAKLARTT